MTGDCVDSKVLMRFQRTSEPVILRLKDTRTSRYGKYNLVYPSYNRETEGGRTFQANGAKLWNSIPLDIRKKDSIGSFKSFVRKYFLSKNS